VGAARPPSGQLPLIGPSTVTAEIQIVRDPLETPLTPLVSERDTIRSDPFFDGDAPSQQITHRREGSAPIPRREGSGPLAPPREGSGPLRAGAAPLRREGTTQPPVKREATGVLPPASTAKREVTGVLPPASTAKREVTGTLPPASTAKREATGTLPPASTAKREATGTLSAASTARREVTSVIPTARRETTGLIATGKRETTGLLPAMPRTQTGPITPIPDHLRNRLRYVAITVEMTGGGIDARREDGTSRLVLWRDVVGLVARRLPPAYDGITFVDIVSTAGSTLRLVPWTRLTGDPVDGEGDERPRGVIEHILARCPGAKLDPATRQFLETGVAAQLRDVETLQAHDARLA
jgi:hypothetical protein